MLQHSLILIMLGSKVWVECCIEVKIAISNLAKANRPMEAKCSAYKSNEFYNDVSYWKTEKI